MNSPNTSRRPPHNSTQPIAVAGSHAGAARAAQTAEFEPQPRPSRRARLGSWKHVLSVSANLLVGLALLSPNDALAKPKSKPKLPQSAALRLVRAERAAGNSGSEDDASRAGDVTEHPVDPGLEQLGLPPDAPRPATGDENFGDTAGATPYHFKVLLQNRFRRTAVDISPELHDLILNDFSGSTTGAASFEQRIRDDARENDGLGLQRAFLRADAELGHSFSMKLLVDFAEL
ncbi:MAG TPA: hypothetical protein VFQ61_09775, partial [Polyangiaceae bacterium]|nr:hypothetical protein [Polyangiaceae bacterium]